MNAEKEVTVGKEKRISILFKKFKSFFGTKKEIKKVLDETVNKNTSILTLIAQLYSCVDRLLNTIMIIHEQVHLDRDVTLYRRDLKKEIDNANKYLIFLELKIQQATEAKKEEERNGLANPHHRENESYLRVSPRQMRTELDFALGKIDKIIGAELSFSLKEKKAEGARMNIIGFKLELDSTMRALKYDELI